ncbi:hypothetical protein H4R99_005416 [Coemansia sp. RSA 1722]|nr:hypothetical protein LPJ57_004211 [Coemansia sp. RSA 486]KAJ2233540.1 hypothetical protein IWW45_004101 [Coemansia sp. RSA 485]KAJ2595273.1 hypothetical protein H4R99_005416 [Coemansia sp. RSA 1722]
MSEIASPCTTTVSLSLDRDANQDDSPVLQQHRRTLSKEEKLARVEQKRRIEQAAAGINAYLTDNRYILAVDVLADLLQKDIFGSSEYMQTSAVVRQLTKLFRNDDNGRLSSVCLEAIGRNRSFLSFLTQAKIGSFVRELYCAYCYDCVVYLGEHMTADNVGAKSARTVLMAVRKQQVGKQQKMHSFGQIKRKRQIMNVEEYLAGQCQYRVVAQHMIRLLAGRGTLNSGHLGKQLEIDLSSVDPQAILPHNLLLWLRGFRKHKIRPDISAMTVIINMYLQHGDSAFATWIYRQMVRGSVLVTQQDYSVERVDVPTPNAVTEALLADVWIKHGDFDPVIRLLSQLKQKQNRAAAAEDKQPSGVLERLVTRTVAGLVDRGRIDEAEAIWKRYGQQGDTQKSPNIRALVKLSLGHIRASNLNRAFELFQDACQSISRDDVATGHICMLHFTSLFNSLLHALLRHSPRQKHTELVHACFSAAKRYGVPFNTTTYNIMLARLARIARTDGGGRRKLAAEATAKLYKHMVDHDVGVDDMTLCHLVPAWMAVGQEELVRINLEWHISGRNKAKIGQLKRHLHHHLEHWGLDEAAIKHVARFLE